MMKKISVAVVLLANLTLACRTDEGNERLAETSENVGKSAATAVKSIKKGIEKISQIKIEVSEGLKERGVSTGKITLDSKGGRHNVLNVYLIFDKAINRNLSLKIYNNEGIEIGRTKVLVKGEAGDAKIVDFVFDKRTNIDRDNKIVLE
jgi:CRISPR/Cas system-associated protein Cas5 (RAMP superfamily)